MKTGLRIVVLGIPLLALAAWLATAASPGGLAALWTILTTQRPLLWHTLGYGLGVAAAATGLAWALAHVQFRYRVPGGRTLRLLYLAPLLVPSFTFAMGLLILLGHNGVVTRLLPGIEVYGAVGLVVAGTLCRLPFAYLPLSWAYRRLDRRQLEAAVALGAAPRDAFWQVALPRLLPILASTALVVLADAILDLANPLVIGGGFTTVAQRLYEAVNGEGDPEATAAYALLLAVPAVLLGVVALRVARQPTRPAPPPPAPEQPATGWARVLIGVSWTVGGTILVLLGTVVAGSAVTVAEAGPRLTLRHFQDLLAGPASRPLATTLVVSLVAVPVVVVAAFRLAAAAATSDRIRQTHRLLTAASALPPAALGVAGLFALNAVSGLAAPTLPVQVATWSALVVIVAVHVMRFVPMVALPVLGTARSLVPAVRDSAIAVGARPADLDRSVYWPRVRTELLGGAFTAWARSLTAVSSVILLTNSQVPLLTVRMLTDIDAGRLAPACAATVVLAGLVGLAAAGQRLVDAGKAHDRRLVRDGAR